jgi:hypothetical protein
VINFKSKSSRRSFLSALAATSGGLLAPSGISFGKSRPSVAGHPVVRVKSGLGSTGDVWGELGVTPLVNINGTLTVIGGSVIPAEAMELYRQGNEHCTSINDLEVAAGKWMAKLCKWPAGYTGLVTSGAAAGIMVAYAGMMTEDLTPRIRQCPNVTGFPKTQVIIQKSHRNPFDHQIRQTGATLVEVETKDEMIQKRWPSTFCISMRIEAKFPARKSLKLRRRTTFMPLTTPLPTCRPSSAYGPCRRKAGTLSRSAAARTSRDRRPPDF